VSEPDQDPLDTGNRGLEMFNTHVRVIWGMFLFLILFYVMYLHVVVRPEFSQSQDPETNQLTPSIHLEFISRYTLGLKFQFDKLNTGETLTYDELLLSILTKNALTYPDKVAVISVIAEISGKKYAFDYLEKLKSESDFPHKLIPALEFFKRIYMNGATTSSLSDDTGMSGEYGWFSKLAYLYGSPSSDPGRQALMEKSKKTVAAVSLATLLFFTGLAGGCALFILAVYKVIKKRLVLRYIGAEMYNRFQNIFFLETMVIFMVISMLVCFLRFNLPIYIYYLLYFVTPFLIFWIVYRGVPLKQLIRSIGWHRGQGVIKEMICGLAGYIAGIPLVIAGGMVTIWIQNLTGDISVHPVAGEIMSSGPWKVVWIFILATVIAPFFEETIFRGVFYNFLRKNHSVIFSVFLTGLFFAVIHPQGFAAVPVICIIGINLALIREWRDSLIASMTAHACNNFVITCLLYFVMA